ncbi:hypothetical protein D3C75_1265820 [compost metagenome]
MGAKTDDFQLIPALTLRCGYYANLNVFRFEDRALLNMQLKGGVDRHVAHGVFTGVANLLQRLTDTGALCIAA